MGGRRSQLFCAWLAWSRYRVVLPTWDRKLGTLLACLDASLRRVRGAPTYLLTDNEKTVNTDRVAGVRVRHPVLVATARHYGLEVQTCVVEDPESKRRWRLRVLRAEDALISEVVQQRDESCAWSAPANVRWPGARQGTPQSCRC